MLLACGRWFALSVDPCLGDRLTDGTAFVARKQSLSPQAPTLPH